MTGCWMISEAHYTNIWFWWAHFWLFWFLWSKQVSVLNFGHVMTAQILRQTCAKLWSDGIIIFHIGILLWKLESELINNLWNESKGMHFTDYFSFGITILVINLFCCYSILGHQNTTTFHQFTNTMMAQLTWQFYFDHCIRFWLHDYISMRFELQWICKWNGP